MMQLYQAMVALRSLLTIFKLWLLTLKANGKILRGMT